MRLVIILACALALAGCQTTGLSCPPGAELPKQDKAAFKRAYAGMTAEQKAAAGPLVKFVDRIERTCAAIARAR